MKPWIKFKKLHVSAVIPRYQSAGAAGFDFHSIEDAKFQKAMNYKSVVDLDWPPRAEFFS